LLCMDLQASLAGAAFATTTLQCNANDTAKWNGDSGHSQWRRDMTSCGTKCLGQKSCVPSCMRTKGWSSSCATCFGNLAGCTAEHCLTKCLDGRTPSCLSCLKASGCDTAAFGPGSCTGFDEPSTPNCTWQTHGCKNSVGVCNTNCRGIPKSDKCVCGPARSDVINKTQCNLPKVRCDPEEDGSAAIRKELRSAKNQPVNSQEGCGPSGCCKWQTHGCLNHEGVCNKQCQWTQDSTSANPVCTCGPAAQDRINEEQCQACAVEDGSASSFIV